MQRFITLEANCGETVALTEAEFREGYANSVWNVPLGNDLACWVWQYANGPAQALNQHVRKYNAWEADPTKHTY